MISNIGGENNIHANHLNIFIFSSLLLSSINSKLVGRMNFIQIGNTPYNNTSPIEISFDMKNYNMVYAVGYASNIRKYVGGLFMPKIFFHIHPQVIDYYDCWSGVVDYNDTLKKFTITSNIEGYQLYIYAVNV